MATKKVEDGIRSYLGSLGKTNKPVVDREAVRSLKAEIRSAEDPLAKLRLLAALEEAEQGVVPDASGDKAVFVAEAKAWAQSESIPVSAFQALGVDDDVLKEAGFEVIAGRATAPARAAGGSRAPRIPIEEVAKAAAKLGSGWKVADLAEAIGREKGTTTNYVKQLLESGAIKDLGDDPKHDGRGRAPKLYGKG